LIQLTLIDGLRLEAHGPLLHFHDLPGHRDACPRLGRRHHMIVMMSVRGFGTPGFRVNEMPVFLDCLYGMNATSSSLMASATSEMDVIPVR